MTVRQWLDTILGFIDSASLNDTEFNTYITITTASVYNLEAYKNLKDVLISREAVSTQLDRLKFFFLAKDVEISEDANPAKSNILIGKPL